MVGPSSTRASPYAQSVTIKNDRAVLPPGIAAVDALTGAEPLDELVMRFPGLADVMKVYRRDHFVPVRLGLRTTPKNAQGAYRADLKVRGIYVVDRSQLRRTRSDRVIKQDYLVVFNDGRAPSYYSGRWANMPPDSGLYFKRIGDFCSSDIGVLGQYGCPSALGHHYSEDDPDLPHEPEFQSAFAEALAEARRLEGLT